MVKKDIHGILNCEDCRQIYLLILERRVSGESAVGFNELLKLCQNKITKEYSPGRLNRHLKGLEKEEFTTRKKGNYKDIISATTALLKDDALSKRTIEYEQLIEKLPEYTLEKLVALYINFHWVKANDDVIILMEGFLNKGTVQHREFKLISRRLLVDNILNNLIAAMRNRKESEYIEILKILKNNRHEVLRN